MENLNQLKFVKLDREGLDTLIMWAEAEGWNPGPHDGEVFWQTDPDGYYGYYHDGKLIAGGSVVSYSGCFGFMGFFIVKPEYRSAGIGRKLWMERRNLLLSRIKKDAAIGMDGVVAMQQFYSRGGFKIAYRDERYARKGERLNISPNILPIEPGDYSDIEAYDTQCLGYSRPGFLKAWLNMPKCKTFKHILNRQITGFSVLRKAAVGYKIGPLFADDASIAEELYKACLNEVRCEDVYLDIPVQNEKALELVKKYKASYVFECARMYYGTPPKQEIEKIFGITTFELG
ncbi:MAG: GNAT family N-acetyltransferase [Bacteroidales bacterium]|nr:GNAT family N-acetyltransferase [Bacteroidales bacterium]